MNDVRGLESRILERFDTEVASRREMEKRLFSVVEERTTTLRNELAKESKNRYDSIEHLKQCLENDFPRLQEALKNESIEREEADASLQRRVEEEGSRLGE